MFTSTLHSSWDERSRRGLTTLTSFSVQALVGGVLLILPLLRPTGLPSLRPLSTPVSLGQPIAEPVAARTGASGNAAAPSNPAAITLRMPTRIPNSISAAGDDGPPTVGPSGPYIPGTLGPGSPDGVLQFVWNNSTPDYAGIASACCSSSSHLACERGRSGSQDPAGISPAGAKRPHSRAGHLTSRDQQAGRH